MISVTILYPNADDATFDMGYDSSSRMPMVAAAFGDGRLGWGAATVTSGQHLAMGWLLIDSTSSFDATMSEHGAAIMADVANDTDQQPEVILGEVTRAS